MAERLQGFPEGFHALVIGASRGIGAALVEALLARGAGRVWAASRSGHCPVDDARVQTLVADVTDEASLAAALQRLDRPLSLAVHTPGLLQDAQIRPERRLAEVTLAGLQHSFAVNAFGPILAVKHLLAHMDTTQPAVLASLSARVGSIGDNHLGGWYGYRAAKAAQNQLLHTAAIEAARKSKSLVVCTLHPGTVDTQLTRPFHANIAADQLFTPQRSAAHLLDVIARLKPSDSGGFYAWDGAVIPW